MMKLSTLIGSPQEHSVSQLSEKWETKREGSPMIMEEQGSNDPLEPIFNPNQPKLNMINLQPVIPHLALQVQTPSLKSKKPSIIHAFNNTSYHQKSPKASNQQRNFKSMLRGSKLKLNYGQEVPMSSRSNSSKGLKSIYQDQPASKAPFKMPNQQPQTVKYAHQPDLMMPSKFKQSSKIRDITPI